MRQLAKSQEGETELTRFVGKCLEYSEMSRKAGFH